MRKYKKIICTSTKVYKSEISRERFYLVKAFVPFLFCLFLICPHVSISAMLLRLVFVTSLAFPCTISQNVAAASKVVSWVLGNSANPSQLQPGGEDHGGTLYVARARVNGEWIPGKGYYSDNTFYTAVAWDGGELISFDNQALLGGRTSWVPVQINIKELPSSAVVGGYDPRTHLPEYICRGFVYENGRPWMIIGKYVEDLFACRVAYFGEKQVTSFEILVEV